MPRTGWAVVLLIFLAMCPAAAQAQPSPSAQAIENQAVSLFNAGRYAEAEPLFLRVLASRERTLGPEHPDTLVAVRNMGGLYIIQQRY
ncbi:MAG TPA: tetratricopeptide repeat protein, partial [Allosphingosinicella sp.]|nr:tetratricopeptide repeat protein [Allosphingosinicella sp.]